MSYIIEKMNHVLKNWKSQFDTLSVLPLEFTESGDKMYLNDLPLCISTDMDLLFARFSAKKILFTFKGQKTIQIQIAWPEDEGPVLSAVSLVYHNTQLKTKYQAK